MNEQQVGKIETRLRLIDRWSLPFILSGGMLACVFIVLTGWTWTPELLVFCLLFFCFASLILLGAAFYHIKKKNRAKGFTHLVLFFLITGPVFLYVYFILFAQTRPDEFAKDIVIPPDMQLEKPRGSYVPNGRPESDPEAIALVSAFDKEAEISSENGFTFNVESDYLDQFSGKNRNLLLRHLATSSKWFLTEKKGAIYAHRRFVVRGNWSNTLNGFYTHSDLSTANVLNQIYKPSAGKEKRFQVRVIIAPDGPVMSDPWLKSGPLGWLKENVASLVDANDSTAKVKVIAVEKAFSKNGTYFQGHKSYLVVRSGAGAIEIFEQSQNTGRHMTPLALRQMKTEMNSVLQSKTSRERGFDTAFIPPISVRKGPAEMVLVKGSQGGMYRVYGYINPGEPGYIYLKAFEATKNTSLSSSRLRDKSLEYVGWSENPQQTFFFNSLITIYEGDWGDFYPARFEIWFVPFSGKPERKLLQKNFKIEGWMR